MTAADETLRPLAAPSAAQRFAVGGVIADRYRIVQLVGTGGMGEVYAAHDLVLDASVALKTLRPELEGSADAVARLRREIALARNVTNPHICRLYDVGEHDGRVFLTMELLRGRTLGEVIRQRELTILEVERLASQLVDGLAALHRASIIHRDFKTSNVIVVGEGDQARAVITDFGLARSTSSEDVRLTHESSLLGTPAYMAPEQVEARPATAASDIYALGVVLFELLTRELPFEEETAWATATARLQRDPPRPSSRRKGVPARWDDIVLRCLAREPSNRFARVDDLFVPQRRSRRSFLLAGGGAAIAAGLGIWRYRGCVDDVALTDDDFIAVLPIEGTGTWLDDPWRMALSFDVHDALATTGMMTLPLHTFGGLTTLDGPGATLLTERDPTAAAYTIPRVRAVVRTTMVRHDPLEVEVVVDIRGHDATRTRLSRSRDEAPQLVIDIATTIASSTGFPPPPPPRDAAALPGPTYERYGQVAGYSYRRNAPDKLETVAAFVHDAPNAVRAGALLAEQASRAAVADEGPRVEALLDKTIALADRILQVNPDQPRAHAARGRAALMRWDWKLADAETRRAIELARHLEAVIGARQLLLLVSARFEEVIALVEHDHVPHPRLGDAPLIWHYYYARRWQDVIRVGEPVKDKLDLNNLVEGVRAGQLALAYFEMGHIDEALALADKLRAAKMNDYALAGIVKIYVATGRIDDAKAIRDRVGDKTGLDVAAHMADALGDIDGALSKLEKLSETHSQPVLFLKIERYSTQLRSTPRFQALLKKVGFP